MQNAGFETAVISNESLSTSSPYISPIVRDARDVVYRGWMLSPSDYNLLLNVINNQNASAFTSLSEYLATHYLPNWYPQITDLTPKTKFYSVDDDLETELKILGWSRFFIKDYVKSGENFNRLNY